MKVHERGDHCWILSKSLDASLGLISEADVVVERARAQGTLSLWVMGVEGQHPRTSVSLSE